MDCMKDKFDNLRCLFLFTVTMILVLVPPVHNLQNGLDDYYLQSQKYLESSQKRKYSRVDITASSSSNGPELTFTVSAMYPYELSLDAPWRLSIKKSLNQSNFLNFIEFNRGIPGFKYQTSTRHQTAQASRNPALDSIFYELVSFCCTSDKKMCFRELHKGKVEYRS